MVLEVGLGGRLDAVNIIDADVAVLCSIGLDHREWLGDHAGADRRARKPGSFAAGSPWCSAAATCRQRAGMRCATRVLGWTAQAVRLRIHWHGASARALGLPRRARGRLPESAGAGAGGRDAISQCRHRADGAGTAGARARLRPAAAIARGLTGVACPGASRIVPARSRNGSWMWRTTSRRAVLARNLAARPMRRQEARGVRHAGRQGCGGGRRARSTR